jgi:hypothetical protein
MQPIHVTDAIARLLANPSQREAFASDKRAYLEALPLSEPDRACLSRLNTTQLDKQAHTLIRKRWFEVSNLLPDTCARLSPNGKHLFFTYAPQFWPEGIYRHMEDAYAFCRFLKQTHSQKVCRMEMNKMDFLRNNKWLGVYPLSNIPHHNKPGLQVIIRLPYGQLHEGTLYFG